MNILCKGLAGAAILTGFVGVSAANAIPSVSLYDYLGAPTNAISSIDNFSFDPSTNAISFEETWDSAGIGRLVFNDLVANVNYTVTIKITNNSGVNWTRFSNELLDPADTGIRIDLCVHDPSLCMPDGPLPSPFFISEDLADDPYPAGYPPGFSPSNDSDGLSFAQDAGIPRTSNVFGAVFVDELLGRDFVDYTNGLIPPGGMDFISFGLRDVNGLGDDNCDDPGAGNEEDGGCVNLPFLMVQQPNFLVDPDGNTDPISQAPEPATLAIFGIGLAGLGLIRRRRTV